MTTLEKTYQELGNHDYSREYSHATFDLVDQLIAELGEKGLADRILDDTPEDVPWQDTASILAIAVWSTSDNGTQISRDSEQWILSCNDERKAYIALNLDVYPFREPSEMYSALSKLAEHFPALGERCHAMIAARKRQEA